MSLKNQKFEIKNKTAHNQIQEEYCIVIHNESMKTVIKSCAYLWQ